MWADWSAPYLTLQPEYEARWAERSRDLPRLAQIVSFRGSAAAAFQPLPTQAAQLGVFGAMFLQGLLR